MNNNEVLNTMYGAKGNREIALHQPRFPMEMGVLPNVTLVSKVDGYFMNIYFETGKDNTILGNVADRLLDMYPEQFMIKAVNGVPYTGTGASQFEALSNSIISKLQEQYDLVPKQKKETARERAVQDKIVAVETSENKKTEYPTVEDKPKYQKVK
jgi:hypothetical protein